MGLERRPADVPNGMAEAFAYSETDVCPFRGFAGNEGTRAELPGDAKSCF